MIILSRVLVSADFEYDNVPLSNDMEYDLMISPLSHHQQQQMTASMDHVPTRNDLSHTVSYSSDTSGLTSASEYSSVSAHTPRESFALGTIDQSLVSPSATSGIMGG